MGKRSLSDSENAEVVKAVRRLLDRGETQTSLATKLGVSQGSLSSLLSGRHRAGWAFARDVAGLLDADLDDLLAGYARFHEDRARSDETDVYPARENAISTVFSAMSRILTMRANGGDAKSEDFWMRKFYQALTDIQREREAGKTPSEGVGRLQIAAAAKRSPEPLQSCAEDDTEELVPVDPLDYTPPPPPTNLPRPLGGHGLSTKSASNPPTPRGTGTTRR